MANRRQFELTEYQRRTRHFSTEFKKQRVLEIERNETTIGDISREYEVSYTAIYNWLQKFSKTRRKGHIVVVETKSDTNKLRIAQKRIQELERIIGQKQLQIDFQAKMIELAEREYGIDIKKKLSSKQSTGTGSIGKSTPSK